MEFRTIQYKSLRTMLIILYILYTNNRYFIAAFYFIRLTKKDFFLPNFTFFCHWHCFLFEGYQSRVTYRSRMTTVS